MIRQLTRLSVLALALLSAWSGVAQAQEASPLSFNASVTSDYRYRGISQTRFKPAVQAGVDYAANGFYVGAWGSTIKWIKDNGVSGSTELDIYGGYKGEISPGLGFDIGALQYAYIGNKLADTLGGGIYKSANTTEVYGALTFGPVTGKLSYAVSDLFGNIDTEGSLYGDISATFDLGNGFSLVPHVGYQKVKNLSIASYTDYALTLTKDFGNGLSASAAFVGTNADEFFYVPGVAANSTEFLGKNGGLLTVKYTF